MDNNLKNTFVFISVDGDGIGQKVARAELADDEEGLHAVSSRIEAGNALVADFAVKNGGQVLSNGGDEVVARININNVEDLESLRTDYAYAVGATLTVGIGQSLSQATKALMVGKLTGKNQTLQYTPEVEQQYQDAMKSVNDGTATGEAKKIGDAYMKKEQPVKQGEAIVSDPSSPMPEEEQVMGDSQSAVPEAAVAEDDHSDCPYCNEDDAQSELEEDDCPYCAEDAQVEQETGLDDCPYCEEAHPQDQHQHGDDCPHCQELDGAQAQEGSPESQPEAAVPAGQEVVDNQMQAPAPDESNVADDTSAVNELNTGEHKNPEEVMEEFDAVHGEDPSQDGQTDTDQIGDVGIAEGNTRQEDNVSRPGDFDGQIQEGSSDPMNTDGSEPNYGEVLQDGLNDNSDDIAQQKVGDQLRMALQQFKANKQAFEDLQHVNPQAYQSVIMILRATIDLAKHAGFGGSAQPEQEGELGQEQAELVSEQPDFADNAFPQHPENGGASAEDSSDSGDNAFPQHPENGSDSGKPQGQ
jgi:hypothetical protein